MRLKTTSTALLAAAVLTGCGGGNGTKGASSTPQPLPPPPGFTVTVGAGKFSVDGAKTLPVAEQIRVDYTPLSDTPTTVRIFNNAMLMSKVAIKKGDRIHVLLQPLTPGKLVVKAAGHRATIKVAAPTG